MFLIFVEVDSIATPAMKLACLEQTNVFGMAFEDERFKIFWSLSLLRHRKLVFCH